MEKNFKLHSDQESRILFGCQDANLRLMEDRLGVKIVARGENLSISGREECVNHAARMLNEIREIIRTNGNVRQHEVYDLLERISRSRTETPGVPAHDRIEVFSRRQYILPKTPGQRVYVEAMRNFDIVYGIGPAGTGKTYLAMAMAVEALKKQQVSRIILTRPAVEAGESLGFLPGDLLEKVNPYLRPLYDALYDMMEGEQIRKSLDRGTIEVAPLAYMRGRTLNASFIILDEAQNCTPEQMKMFLTRLGFDSKTVITGDLTQSDLPAGKPIGLLHAESLLSFIEGIKFIYLTRADVVRHELVQKIIEAYENEKTGGGRKKKRRAVDSAEEIKAKAVK